jgi:hypothetical protein
MLRPVKIFCYEQTELELLGYFYLNKEHVWTAAGTLIAGPLDGARKSFQMQTSPHSTVML